MSLLVSLLLISPLVPLLQACLPTEPGTTTTTTFICCPILTSSTLLKTTPAATDTGAILEQCSILRRISSNCGDQAYLTCEAAPYTNPTNVFIQLFDAASVKITEIEGNAQIANAVLVCDHLTGVYKFNGVAVSRVSCAQDGSSGANAPDSIFT